MVARVSRRSTRGTRNDATMSDIDRTTIAARISAGVMMVLQSCSGAMFAASGSGRQLLYLPVAEWSAAGAGGCGFSREAEARSIEGESAQNENPRPFVFLREWLL